MPKIFLCIGWLLCMVAGRPSFAQQPDTTRHSGDTSTVKTKELKTITVSGVKNNLVEHHIDKIVVNADAMISASGGSAVDILNGSPGVLVDESGGISLKGKSGVVIYINDRPARLSGADLLSYLKSLPASMIDKVELLSNPSAKYNADGSAIINIKTKKIKTEGFNGSIAPSAGFGRYFRSNNSLQLNYRINQFNFFINGAVNITNSYFKGDRERRYNYTAASPAYTLLQQVAENGHDISNNYQAGVDYDVSKYTSMSLLVDGFVNPYHETGNYVNRFFDPLGKQDSTLVSVSRYKIKPVRNSINYNLKHGFAGGRRELTLYLDYLRFQPRSSQTLESSLYNTAGTLLQQYTFLPAYNFKATIYSARADYSDTILKSIKWEQGIQTLYSERNNSSIYFTQTGNAVTPNDDLTNSFRYREAIQAAYINLQQSVGKITIQAGLRMESTHGSALQYNRPGKSDTAFTLQYTNLFPTGYLMYKPDSAGRHVWGLSIGRRIERPDYNDLNPSSFYFDKNTSITGNSLLRPAFTTNIELSYTYKSTFNVGINWSGTNGLILRAFKQEGEAFITVPVNVDRYTVLGTNLNWPIPITRWWKLNLYQQWEFRHYEGAVFKDEDKIDQRLVTFYLKTYSQFFFNRGWSADLTTTYRSKLLIWQSTMQPIYQLHAGVQKKLNKQSTLTLAANDIFHTWGIKRTINIPNAYVFYDLTFDTQRFSVTWRYRFGKAMNNRERKTGIDAEAGRAH